MIYDFKSFVTQFELQVPIPGAFVVDIDWNAFRNA